ncbi:MAG: hypothetical protein MJY87_02490 [Fibrobacter sp.]|nr:hypothetical protein [Fibrobacter sp.]
MARDGSLLERINRMEAIKLYCVVHGRYSEYLRAYSRTQDGRGWASPLFHDYFSSQIEFAVQSLCGIWLGRNVNDPQHPVRKLLNESKWRSQK